MNLDLAGQAQICLGLYEREIHPSLRRLSSNIRCAVSIGAGYGEEALYFLMRTSAQRVMAFEPSPYERAQIQSNLELNGLANASRFTLSEKWVGAIDDGRTCTLDAILPQLLFPCLVMMDIDGGEMQVLRGAQKFVASSGVRWLIETHSKDLENQCIELLERSGYVTKIIPNAWWRIFLPELRPIEHNRWLVATRS